eukprot:482223-Amphidinium_carterae.1
MGVHEGAYSQKDEWPHLRGMTLRGAAQGGSWKTHSRGLTMRAISNIRHIRAAAHTHKLAV